MNGKIYEQIAGAKVLDYDIIFPLKKCFVARIELRCPSKPQEHLLQNFNQSTSSFITKPHMECINGQWKKIAPNTA